MMAAVQFDGIEASNKGKKVEPNEVKELYAWGAGTHGQCGIGRSENKILAPTKVDLDFIWLTDIQCGGEHSLILTSTGELYSCGMNKSGQLGLGHKESKLKPEIVYFSGEDTVDIE